MNIQNSQGLLKRVSVSAVHTNPWNPNMQSEEEFEAVRSGLAIYGQVAPLVVRTHPKKKDQFELVDGEHRLLAMQEIGIKECDAYDLGKITDAKAKKLTVVLSEARGRNDHVKLGKVMEDLMQQLDPVEMLAGIPQTMDQVNDLIELARTGFTNEVLPNKENEDEYPSRDEYFEDQDLEKRNFNPEKFSFGPFHVGNKEVCQTILNIFAEHRLKEPNWDDSDIFVYLMTRIKPDTNL